MDFRSLWAIDKDVTLPLSVWREFAKWSIENGFQMSEEFCFRRGHVVNHFGYKIRYTEEKILKYVEIKTGII